MVRDVRVVCRACAIVASSVVRGQQPTALCCFSFVSAFLCVVRASLTLSLTSHLIYSFAASLRPLLHDSFGTTTTDERNGARVARRADGATTSIPRLSRARGRRKRTRSHATFCALCGFLLLKIFFLLRCGCWRRSLCVAMRRTATLGRSSPSCCQAGLSRAHN